MHHSDKTAKLKYLCRMPKAQLLLSDGTYFEGKALGATTTCTGEIAFNTSMTGYQEIITDPSYTGQVLILNNCYTGNYGTKATDVESDAVRISALILKNVSGKDSRAQSDKTLDQYLIDNNIPCIYDIDTRALVQHVRDAGAMNCIVSTEDKSIAELKALLAAVPSMEGLELSSTVTTKEAYTWGDENAAIKIAVMDYGVKRNILQCMSDRGAYLKVFPATTSFADVDAFAPDAFFISNGPGDPSTMQYAVDNVKHMLDTNKPLFGICLGNQLLGLAVGIPTYKMHAGHRGGNHPVLNVQNGLGEISTQNHGFALEPQAVRDNAEVEVTHYNLNDDTIEGIRLKNKPAFSVQYHPEATPGPHDSRYLFDDFINLIKQTKAAHA
jgi:carbamoyl-phosphate synthase small subunit